MDDKHSATEKAKQLVSMAVAKATLAKQLRRKKINVDKAVLIIGAGVSGISAALEMSAMGYKVYLTESSDRLGGNALRLGNDVYGRDVYGYLQKMIHSAGNDSNITVFTNSSVNKIEGYVGNFKTMISTPEGDHEITHGVVIVAVGAKPRITDKYLYGKNDRILMHSELEQIITDTTYLLKNKKDIVLIQCVDSRNDAVPYCSRVCCNQAIRIAIGLKEYDPQINVTILYREIRSYGQNEQYYVKARKLGVQFVHFDDDDYPVVTEDGSRLSVFVNDSLLGRQIEYPADIVSLSSPIQPDVSENTRLAQMLKVPLNREGFFLEAHVKLRPLDFATEGVYLAGLAHSPKSLKECFIQGKAAAGRAATVVSKEILETEGTVACVDPELCVACKACQSVCAYKAIEVQQITWRRQPLEKAVVNDVLCKGCGTCSAVCRCGAVDVGGFSDSQILSEIEYLLRT